MPEGVKVGKTFEIVRDDGSEFRYSIVLDEKCVAVENDGGIYFGSEEQIDAFAGILKDFLRLGRNISASAEGFDLCKLRDYIEPPSEDILAWVTGLLEETRERVGPCGKRCRDVEF